MCAPSFLESRDTHTADGPPGVASVPSPAVRGHGAPSGAPGDRILPNAHPIWSAVPIPVEGLAGDVGTMSQCFLSLMTRQRGATEPAVTVGSGIPGASRPSQPVPTGVSAGGHRLSRLHRGCAWPSRTTGKPAGPSGSPAALHPATCHCRRPAWTRPPQLPHPTPPQLRCCSRSFHANLRNACPRPVTSHGTAQATARTRCVVAQRDQGSSGNSDAVRQSRHWQPARALATSTLPTGRGSHVLASSAERRAVLVANSDVGPSEGVSPRLGHPTKPPPPREPSPGVAFAAETKEASYKPPVPNFIWENEMLGFSQTVTVLRGCNLVGVAGFSARGCLIKSVS